MKFKSFLSIIILTVAFSLNAFTQATLSNIVKKGEIRIGMSGNQPPFSMTAKDGTLMGYEVDIANMLAESLGVKLELVEIPFPELLDALENGYVDAVMSGMTITPERNMKAMFAGPYTLSGKSILTKSSVLAKIEEAEEIDEQHYKVTCLRGSTSQTFVEALMPNAEMILVDDYDTGVDMILNDKADAMVADFPVCAVSVLKYQHLGLVTLEEPLTIEPIGVALPSNDPQFLNLIDNYLVSLELAGYLVALEQMWFEDGTWILQMK